MAAEHDDGDGVDDNDVDVDGGAATDSYIICLHIFARHYICLFDRLLPCRVRRQPAARFFKHSVFFHKHLVPHKSLRCMDIILRYNSCDIKYTCVLGSTYISKNGSQYVNVRNTSVLR